MSETAGTGTETTVAPAALGEGAPAKTEGHKRERSRSEHRHRHHHRSPSSSSSSSSSSPSDSSSSSSSSSSEKDHKKRDKSRDSHHHRRSHSHSKHRHRSHSPEAKKAHKEHHHKHHKKDKDKKHKHKHHHRHHKDHTQEKRALGDGAQWGKYGVLQDADRARMRPEFYAWLADVRHLDAETLTDHRAEADLWRTFVEDYNTATLPGTKYYNLAAWEQQQARARAGGVLPCAADAETGFVDDEAAVRAEQQRRREQQRRELLAAQVREMRGNAAKVSEMTHQEELRRLQQHLWRAGDEAGAQKIADRLRPDEK